MAHKHIDPEPDHRYIIRTTTKDIGSATVIESTDRFVRLKWDEGSTVWYSWDMFQPYHDGTYDNRLQILEKLKTLG